jgi:putative ABC transport system permease protein
VHTLRNLQRRKLRSVLTIAGISVGIVALVVFGSMANRIDSFVNANADYLEGTVVVSAQGTTQRFVQPLSSSAVAAVRELAGSAAVLPSVQLTVEADEGMPSTLLPDTIVGVEAGAAVPAGAYVVSLAQGRELQASDANANVAVLGSDVALHYEKQIGDTIKLRDEQFEVVGIYQATLAVPDSEVLVPMAAAQRLFIASLPEQYRKSLQPSDVVTTLMVYLPAGADADEFAARIAAAAPDTRTMTSDSVVKEIGSITKLLQAILIGVGLLSLIVGGLSVINTMAMAVAERTREIGIKRAIGGSRSRVVREIVSESACIGFIGGTVGLAAGALIVFVGNEIGRSGGTVLFDLTASTAIQALAFATILGALAGFFPALNAARLDPVAALRYE